MFQGKENSQLFISLSAVHVCTLTPPRTHTLFLTYTPSENFKYCNIKRIELLLIKQKIPLTFFSLLAGEMTNRSETVLRLTNMKKILARFRIQDRMMESEDPWYYG